MAGIKSSTVGVKRRIRNAPIERTNVHSLKLVKNYICQDTIDALEYLLYEARKGELIGLVYGGMHKHHSCIVDAVGAGYRDPLFALGVANLLTDVIATRARNDESHD
ncbi:MAG: hypothetical protein K0M39_09190 [Rhizobium sp.]|nr:hypothetical protein [Rhizobium sp.]